MGTSTVSIAAQPAAISSAYRPVLFKVVSTVVAPELQIRGDIYARNDLTGALVKVATKYEKKYLGLNYFMFDFSNILQSYLTHDKKTALIVGTTPTFSSPNNNSIVEYKVYFTEIYYNSNGIPTAYNFVTGAALKAVAAITQHEDVQSLSDYILTDPEVTDGFDGGFSPEFI